MSETAAGWRSLHSWRGLICESCRSTVVNTARTVVYLRAEPPFVTFKDMIFARRFHNDYPTGFCMEFDVGTALVPRFCEGMVNAKEWEETGKETFMFWIKKYSGTLCGWPTGNPTFTAGIAWHTAKYFTSVHRTQQTSQIQTGRYKGIEKAASFPPSQQPLPVHRPKASRIQFTSWRHNRYVSTATFILSSL